MIYYFTLDMAGIIRSPLCDAGALLYLRIQKSKISEISCSDILECIYV